MLDQARPEMGSKFIQVLEIFQPCNLYTKRHRSEKASACFSTYGQIESSRHWMIGSELKRYSSFQPTLRICYILKLSILTADSH